MAQSENNQGCSPETAGQVSVPESLGRARLLVAAVAILAYLNTLNADFTFDDVFIVRDNPTIRSVAHIPQLFALDYWAGTPAPNRDTTLYRPFTLITYTLNRALTGPGPAGFHAVNILLHAAVCVLLFEVLFILFASWRLALVAATLFAVHPIHTEAVAGIVGRAEILAFGGIMGSILLYEYAMKAKRERSAWLFGAGSIAVFFLGMLSKELGIIVPALIVWREWLLLSAGEQTPERKHRRILWLGAAIIAAAVFLGLRSQAISGRGMTMGYMGVAPGLRMATALRVCLEYLELMLFPLRLCAEYWVTEVPIAHSWLDSGVVAAVGALLASAAFIFFYHRRFPAACWGMGVFAAALFPVSNLAFAIGVIKAERLLYTPSAGFFTLLACGITPLIYTENLRRRQLFRSIFALILLLLFARTWVRNRDWHDNLTLARATLKTSPNSPAFHEILAAHARKIGRNDVAQRHFLASLAARRNAGTLFNLGNIARDEKKSAEAESWYHQALAMAPHNPDIINNLALLLEKAGKTEAASRLLRDAIQHNPNHPGAYVNLLSICIAHHDLRTGLPLADKARQRFPAISDIHYNASALYSLAGKKEQARDSLATARALEARQKTGKTRRHNRQHAPIPGQKYGPH